MGCGANIRSVRSISVGHAVNRHADEIHRLRVSIKRLRALWKLILPRSQGTDRFKYLLKMQARKLSQARDLHAIAIGLRKLDAPERLVPDSHAFVSRRSLSSIHKLLADQTKAFQRLPLSRIDLLLALKRSRRLEKKARYKSRRKTADTEDFHKWRKRTKALMYQLEYAEFRGIKGSRGKIRRLRKRGELLGAAHDYEILLRYLRKIGAPPKLLRKTKALREKMERKSLRL